MNKKYVLLSLGSMVLFATAVFMSCTKDEGKIPQSNLTTTTTGGPSPCDTITYTKHIKKILEDRACIACHNDPVGGVGAPPLNTYGEVSDVAQKIKNTVFDANPELMPKGGDPLPQAEKDLITCWLNNGKKQ
ncbi:MAG: hypothetical protein JNL60_07885 [Bacteroidia bacterium]|nr:hypothetical protein [Bacteroidia bacterium]